MRIRHFIARVRRAYAKIGMRPMRGYFLRRRTRHCCPLTALYLAETGKPFHREAVLRQKLRQAIGNGAGFAGERHGPAEPAGDRPTQGFGEVVVARCQHPLDQCGDGR